MGNNATREELKRAFLDGLRDQASVYHAAQAVGINRCTAYRWRAEDEEFARAWDDALEDAKDAMETSIYKRGMQGDGILSMFWMKAKRPDEFRENARLQIDGTFQHVVVLPEVGAAST